MSIQRPDLETARRMLAQEKRRRQWKRRLMGAAAIVLLSALLTLAVLHTRLFADVLRQLMQDLGV